MASVQTNWEDDDNNRFVELDLNYQLEDGRVEITTMTPTSVRFVDSPAKETTRSVGVWTDAGRALLSKQVIAAGRFAEIRSELAAAHTVELDHSGEANIAADAVKTLTA